MTLFAVVSRAHYLRSFEDSSSVSSDISETVDEVSTDDLTGSSLSDTNQFVHPYGYVVSTPNKAGGQRNPPPGPPHQHHYGVLKADSGQQTEKAPAARKGSLPGQQQPSGHSRSGALRPKSDHMNALLYSAELGKQAAYANAGLPPNGRGGPPLSFKGSSSGGGGHSRRALQQQELISIAAAQAQMRPGSSASGHYERFRGAPGQSNGAPNAASCSQPGQYHSLSLDRKKHLASQFGGGGRDLSSMEGGESFYGGSERGGYMPVSARWVQQHQHGGHTGLSPTALAMMSPRHVPFAGDVRFRQQQVMTVNSGGKGHFVNKVAVQPQPQQKTSKATAAHYQDPMTRSLIEAKVLKGPGTHSSSVTMEDSLNGNGGDHGGGGGKIRLSIPLANQLNGVTFTSASSTVPASTAVPSGHSQNVPRSARSSKSESPYASIIQRTDHNGKLTLSTASSSGSGGSYGNKYSDGGARGKLTQPVAPYNPNAPYMQNNAIINKNGDAQGSTWSLTSGSSNCYTTSEEHYQSEIRKLTREVHSYKDKVQNLVSQQSTYDSVVSAFEHSLETMIKRLNHLSENSEQKDQELNEMRSALRTMCKLCRDAGLPFEHVLTPAVQRRSTCSTGVDTSGATPTGSSGNAILLTRQPSNESMSSVTTQKSSLSTNSSGGTTASKQSSTSSQALSDKKMKRSWLRSSFSRAFGKNKVKKDGGFSLSDVEEVASELGGHHHSSGKRGGASGPNGSTTSLDLSNPDHVVQRLQKELDVKDSAITDLRLEALTCAHQLDQVKEELSQYKNRMKDLAADNERMKSQISVSSRASSQTSLTFIENPSRSGTHTSTTSPSHSYACASDLISDSLDDMKTVISITLGLHGDLHRFQTDFSSSNGDILISSLSVNSTIQWDPLDALVENMFKEYLSIIDPGTNLGLSSDSLAGYILGQNLRHTPWSTNSTTPTKSPFDGGVSVSESAGSTAIKITLKGISQNAIDALAFETLIPRSNMQRLVTALLEQKRLLLNGPCGTGKTFMAKKLAEFLVLREGKDPETGAIATFTLDAKNAIDLKQFLANIVEQIQLANGNEANNIPTVLLLDNLHYVSGSGAPGIGSASSGLADAFSPLLSCPPSDCPFIIATTNSSCNTTHLQVHHNFRIVLWANHMEPVRGFLGRYLRRKLIGKEVELRKTLPELRRVIEWLPRCWEHINKILERVSHSSEVTIGPRVFLSCPLDLNKSVEWFYELWNHSIIPYILEAAKEGKQLHGIQWRAAEWEDPSQEVSKSWPWPDSCPDFEGLIGLRLEDIGGDYSQTPPILHPPPPQRADGLSARSQRSSTGPEDPFTMLLRLKNAQEAELELEMERGGGEGLTFDLNRTLTMDSANGSENPHGPLTQVF